MFNNSRQHNRQPKELNVVKYNESLIQIRMYSVEFMPDTFPLLLKLIFIHIFLSPSGDLEKA